MEKERGADDALDTEYRQSMENAPRGGKQICELDIINNTVNGKNSMLQLF